MVLRFKWYSNQTTSNANHSPIGYDGTVHRWRCTNQYKVYEFLKIQHERRRLRVRSIFVIDFSLFIWKTWQKSRRSKFAFEFVRPSSGKFSTFRPGFTGVFAGVAGGCCLTANRSVQYKGTDCVSAFFEATPNYFAHCIKSEVNVRWKK